MSFTKSSLLALAFGLSSVQAHMVMKSPTPYDAASLNNSPLDPSGSDYPCKAVSYSAGGASNEMPVGSTQELSFTGSAVHGGGSCQVSLTTDKNPTKDTKFKVIHSIIGGCPKKGAGGNIGSDPNGGGADTYQYKIPEDLAPGDYTLAWTWFNKVGNREMYMNCAPVTITGGNAARDLSALGSEQLESRDDSALSKLPDMFIANIQGASDSCTYESADVEFPEPGDSVDNFSSGQTAAPGTGDCTGPPPSGGSTGGDQGGSTGGGDQSPGGGAPAPDGGAPVPGVFAPDAGAGEAPPPPSTTTTPAAPPPSQETTPPPSSEQPSTDVPPGNVSSDGAKTGPCSPEGQFSCSADGKTFQQCGSGTWSTVQQVAAGTSCSVGGGPGMKVAAVARAAKRHVRFSHHHAQRRHF
ncbi:MAG: hypothetical protein M1837_000977 [Sclerophora amabilis]|nr:MAG: hypothetical protein M1837_000977 [Sclerophora amabilis]